MGEACVHPARKLQQQQGRGRLLYLHLLLPPLPWLVLQPVTLPLEGVGWGGVQRQMRQCELLHHHHHHHWRCCG